MTWPLPLAVGLPTGSRVQSEPSGQPCCPGRISRCNLARYAGTDDGGLREGDLGFRQSDPTVHDERTNRPRGKQGHVLALQAVILDARVRGSDHRLNPPVQTGCPEAVPDRHGSGPRLEHEVPPVVAVPGDPPVTKLEATGGVLGLDREHSGGADYEVIDVTPAGVDSVVDAVSLVEGRQDLPDMCHASGGTKQRLRAPGRNRTSDTRFRRCYVKSLR
jgi:hypothetical protein